MPVDIDRDELQRIVTEELMYRRALDEGLWDDTQRLMVMTSQRIRSLDVAGKAGVVLDSLALQPTGVSDVAAALREAIAESGERLPVTDDMRLVRRVGAMTEASMDAALAEDVADRISARIALLQRECRYHVELLEILTEESMRVETTVSRTKRIDEGAILGVNVAGMRLIDTVVAGLARLAEWSGAMRTETALKDARCVVRMIEGKGADCSIPDALSFAVYGALCRRGLDGPKLTPEEYANDTDGTRLRVEGLLRSAIPMLFARGGIRAAVHAGVNLLAIVEGAVVIDGKSRR